jgi:hypothetical protein
VSRTHIIAAGINDAIWNESPPVRRRRQGGIWVLAAASLLAIMCGFVVAAMALSRRDYGTFSFWSTPDRINYCGRRYYSAGPVRGTPESFTSSVTGHPTWRRVGYTFELRPIEAPVSAKVAAGGSCTMAVYVPTGRDTYVQYELSGGP